MTQVRDLMTPDPVSVHSHDSVVHAARRMAAGPIDVLVVYESGRVVGFVTEGDLVRSVAAGFDPRTATVAGIAQRLEPVQAMAPAAAAAVQLRGMRATRVPVLDGDHLVGTIAAAHLHGLDDASRRGPAVLVAARPGESRSGGTGAKPDPVGGRGAAGGGAAHGAGGDDNSGPGTAAVPGAGRWP